MVCQNALPIWECQLERDRSQARNTSHISCDWREGWLYRGSIHVILYFYTLYYRCVAYLLTQGADPNSFDDSRRCPMHWAANWGHTICLRHLIKSDANINAQDDKGETPLILAVISGNVGCIQVLANVRKAHHKCPQPLSTALQIVVVCTTSVLFRSCFQDQPYRCKL